MSYSSGISTFEKDIQSDWLTPMFGRSEVVLFSNLENFSKTEYVYENDS